MDEQQKTQSSEQSTTQVQQQSYAVPIAIVIAGALIAFAVYGRGGTSKIQNPGQLRNPENPGEETPVGDIKPISTEDHILGNPDAQVVMIEYSDFECPFCKRFHTTMQQVMSEYGQAGKVAWVYRQLPLEALHKQAPTESIASECVAKLGGNEAFWKFADNILTVTPSNDGLDLSLLPQMAVAAGVDKGAFEACLKDPAIKAKVDASIADAEQAEIRGTPYTVVLSKSGKKYSIGGARDYAYVKTVIEKALKD
ncbi:MAG: thioredoxin domain-containing protein [Patescibacteria group bacterium]